MIPDRVGQDEVIEMIITGEKVLSHVEPGSQRFSGLLTSVQDSGGWELASLHGNNWLVPHLVKLLKLLVTAKLKMLTLTLEEIRDPS